MRALLLALLAAGFCAGQAQAADSPETIYRLRCSGCHGVDGSGDTRVDVAPFAGTIGAFLHDPEGRRYIANVGGVIGSGLNEADTAAVLNWLMVRFAGDSLPKDAKPFDATEMKRLRAARAADAITLRRQIAARLKAQGLSLPEYPWP